MFTLVAIPDAQFSLLCVIFILIFFENVLLMLYGNLELHKPLVEMTSPLFSLILLSFFSL